MPEPVSGSDPALPEIVPLSRSSPALARLEPEPLNTSSALKEIRTMLGDLRLENGINDEP